MLQFDRNDFSKGNSHTLNKPVILSEIISCIAYDE